MFTCHNYVCYIYWFMFLNSNIYILIFYSFVNQYLLIYKIKFKQNRIAFHLNFDLQIRINDFKCKN